MSHRAYHELTDWGHRNALLLHKGLLPIHKFGRNPVVNSTEEEVWPLGGVHTFLTTGTTLLASCTDNVNGQGQTIRVFGLDANWNAQFKDVVLTGTTPVQVGDALGWTHVSRAYQVSASPHPVGDVYIAESDTYAVAGIPDNLSKIQAYVEFANAAHQTEQAWAIVPAGKKLLINNVGGDIEHSGGSSRTAEVLLEVSELAKGSTVSSPLWTPWRRVWDGALSSSAGIMHQQSWAFPLVYTELTRVAMRATASANTEVDAYFHGLIVPDGTGD